MNKFYLVLAGINTAAVGVSLATQSAFGVLVFGLFTAYWLWRANI